MQIYIYRTLQALGVGSIITLLAAIAYNIPGLMQ